VKIYEENEFNLREADTLNKIFMI